jgi:hypothetical protein
MRRTGDGLPVRLDETFTVSRCCGDGNKDCGPPHTIMRRGCFESSAAVGY